MITHPVSISMDFEIDITDEGTKENYSNIPNACWGGKCSQSDFIRRMTQFLR
jgi:hypothetical protein